MKKELSLFLSILFILAITVHFKEFLESPFVHILNLPKSGAYGFGIFHPLIFTFIVYILIFIPRFIFRVFKKR